MPFIGVGLSTLIAIGFAIHVITSGQDRYWLFILFIFPFLGSVVYFIVIFLPSLRNTHTGYQMESMFRKALSPGRELKEAKNAIEISSTTENQLRLAKALVDNNRAEEAIPYYETSLSGVYKNAPDILILYAYALFESKQYAKARETLDYLRETNPNYRSDEGHLLYAKILMRMNEKELAKEEFKALIGYYPSLEALSQYIGALIQWNEIDEAKAQYGNFEMRLKHMPKHSKRLNAQWINEIKQLKSKIN